MISSTQTARAQWYPIAASADLVPRHVFDGMLLGQELAVWRADDGFANIWENRCLHRGVRLTIGLNQGSELQCQYHGWRYANRTASCSYIPAHPANAPSRTVCNKTYPVVEKYGLVWSLLDQGPTFPEVAALEGSDCTPIRAIPINAPSEFVLTDLSNEVLNISDLGMFTVQVSWDETVVMTTDTGLTMVFFAQPVDAARTIIRGVSTAPINGTVLRQLNHALNRLRRRIEEDAKNIPQIDPIEPIHSSVRAELGTMPDQLETGEASLRVVVKEKIIIAEDVAQFSLTPLVGQLPTAQAGAHIDVHLPNGLTRQYSVTNGPGESDIYTIGVKKESQSKGGSETLHNTVQVGDLLSVSPPRNNFPLRRDATKSIFVAGGIGITPLLSMAKTLHSQSLAFELHYFVRSEDHVAFRTQLDALGASVILQIGLSPNETSGQLGAIYSKPDSTHHTYICGPGPMLDAARAAAADAGWNEANVHFEYFKNTNKIDDSSSFEISLARSAKTLRVEAGKTVLEVLRENGVNLMSSCGQGACGTCKVAVIEGEVDHQDVHLSASEKSQNSHMMTCVSRAKSKRLILDI